MSFLTTHGVLHLLGYDHMKKEDEEVMFKIQDEIMDLLHL
jgi:probable rRNA maturation factor